MRIFTIAGLFGALVGCVGPATNYADSKIGVNLLPVRTPGGVIIKSVETVSYPEDRATGLPWNFPKRVTYSIVGKEKSVLFHTLGDGDEVIQYVGYRSFPESSAFQSILRCESYDGPTIHEYYVRMTDGTFILISSDSLGPGQIEVLSAREAAAVTKNGGSHLITAKFLPYQNINRKRPTNQYWPTGMNSTTSTPNRPCRPAGN